MIDKLPKTEHLVPELVYGRFVVFAKIIVGLPKGRSKCLLRAHSAQRSGSGGAAGKASSVRRCRCGLNEFCWGQSIGELTPVASGLKLRLPGILSSLPSLHTCSVTASTLHLPPLPSPCIGSSCHRGSADCHHSQPNTRQRKAHLFHGLWGERASPPPSIPRCSFCSDWLRTRVTTPPGLSGRVPEHLLSPHNH